MVEARSDVSEVVERLAERGLNATPESAERIARHDSPDELVELLRSEFSHRAVITVEDVRGCLGSEQSDTGRRHVETPEHTDAPDDTKPSDHASADRRRVSISNDITGDSTCTGVYTDLVSYFRDRYERLSDMLRSRVSPTTVESARTSDRDDVALVGMVNDVRPTSSDNGDRLVEIEDTTGEIRLLVSDVDVAERLVHDEVVGVEGRMSDDGGIVFVDELHFPDVPRRDPNTATRDVKAVLVSDLHVGSESFVVDKWESFADWLSTRDDVGYLLVAGDLVEGVGVYPGQEEELDIVDIYDQYEACAEHLKRVPDDVEVVAITGNHDSVRLAEPQPALPDEFRDPFGSNVRFSGNPCVVDLEGVGVMMYHGASLNPFVEEIPGVEIESPETGMVEMLRKRHLAPMYGKANLAPEERDYLVMDDVPDVLHTGHVHTVGVGRYNSVTMVNTGAWQSQTDYQRAANIDPDVGYAAVLDLSTLDVELRRF